MLAACQPVDEQDDAWMYRYGMFYAIPYGDHPQQTLDFYRQGSWVGEPVYFKAAPEPRPTLVFIHGGGWMVPFRGSEAWVMSFVERGWHVVSITYRMGPGTAPAAIDDAICALDWVVRNADANGFDREHIVLMGDSAGGHLSLTSGILASRPGHECYPGDDFRVRAVVNWYGVTDIEGNSNWLDENPPPYGNYAKAWLGDTASMADFSSTYSPVHMLHEDSPSVLTIHGTDDAIVPFVQAEALHDKLNALGIENRLLAMQGGKHSGFTDAQFEEAFAVMLEFAGAD